MATFGKKVQPKHRADPADRKRESAPAPRSGTHAAPASPAGAPPEPAQAAQHGVVPAPAASDTTAPEAFPVASPAPTHSPVSTVRQDEPTTSPQPVTESDTLSVLIVDDNEDVRGLLRIAFARADIRVVGAASDSREALALAQHEHPQIVLLDVNLPEVAGLDVLPRLREHCPGARVVMFSAQCNPAVTEAALERGAVGFVEKGVSMKNVTAHLREVAAAPEGQAVQPFPLRVYP